MGRPKKNKKLHKQRISVTIDPKILKEFRKKKLNISAFVEIKMAEEIRGQ